MCFRKKKNICGVIFNELHNNPVFYFAIEPVDIPGEYADWIRSVSVEVCIWVRDITVCQSV
mgnify:CR=1 FL=1